MQEDEFSSKGLMGDTNSSNNTFGAPAKTHFDSGDNQKTAPTAALDPFGFADEEPNFNNNFDKKVENDPFGAPPASD